MYLRDAFKDGPVRHAIESLTHDAECYKEAIDWLRKRYNQLHIIYPAHTCVILDVPFLKDGNSNELQRLHDVAKQRLRALRVMKYETFTTLVTSILEPKLDHTTMFDWQWYTQHSKTVPDFDDLLELLDLRARAGDNVAQEGERKDQVPPQKRRPSQDRQIQPA